jgi:hypothetical protein
MAVGDQTDIYNRLITQLPDWFGTDHPELTALLQAYIGYSDNPDLITTMFFHYNNQYLYAQKQLRIQTATDINLDLISQDYLGSTLPRKTNENDDSYRKRILANVVQERATRQAMYNMLLDLTGFPPVIIEPWSGRDHGYYRQPATLAYRARGGYGSGSYPYQAWIYVYLSAFQGMASYPGYRTTLSGYRARGWYGGKSLQTAFVTESDVLQAIERTKVLGTRMHVKILYR